MWSGAFRAKSGKKRRGASSVAWTRLLGLQWIVDRLHFCYHKACRNKKSSYYLARVNPYRYKEIHGVNSEAAEQVFALANRWTAVLNDMGPDHFALFLLVFAHFHNGTHGCGEAFQVYKGAQQQGQRCTGSDYDYNSDRDSEHECVLPIERKRKKQIRGPVEEVEARDYAQALDTSEEERVPARASLERRISWDEEVVCNFNTACVHLVDPGCSKARCGWAYAPGEPVVARTVIDKKERVWFVCGSRSCCGKSVPLVHAMMPES